MSNYKFNVGDTVKVIKLDDWSCEEMINEVGEIGIIADCDDKEEGINGYAVKMNEDGIGAWFWFMEDSLEFVESEKEDNNCKEEKVSKDDVLSILYEAKENGTINYGTICDLIKRVRYLSCK